MELVITNRTRIQAVQQNGRKLHQNFVKMQYQCQICKHKINISRLMRESKIHPSPIRENIMHLKAFAKNQEQTKSRSKNPM